MGPITEIRDDIFGRTRTALLAVPADTGTPGPIVVVWTDPDSDALPDEDVGLRPWARVTLLQQNAGYSSISGRRRRMEGQLTVQLHLTQKFTSAGDVVQNIADRLGDLLINSDGDTELVDVRVMSRAAEGGWARADVVADFWAIVVGRRSSAPYFSSQPAPPDTGGGSSSQSIIYDDVWQPVTDDVGDPVIGA